MKKNAIITFDYEVFLGLQTGTIENCVIEPTRLILEILQQNNAKAIFFVDTTWLLFLQENFSGDFQIISQQLRDIIKSGSSIELHLHPQWKDAYRIGDNIAFRSFNHYSLHSLSQAEILELFRKSIELLKNITNQKVSCFRAGGWCIEPFSQVKIAFQTCGIKFDFSVVPGAYLKEGQVYDYDFSKVPRFPFYYFQNEAIKPEANGSFVEVPISTYNNNPIYRFVNIIILKFNNDKIFGDGKGIQEKSFFFFRSLFRRLQFSTVGLSIDRISNLFFKYLIKTHFRKSQLLVIVSHPKALSNIALRNLSYITKHFNTISSLDLDKFLASNS
jgi:hypothetical protein